MKRGETELTIHPRHELTTGFGAKMELVSVRDASTLAYGMSFTSRECFAW